MKAAARHAGTVITGIVMGCALLLTAAASRASALPAGLPELPGLGEVMQRDNRSGLALSGFDPVAYFSSDAAVPGLPRYELVHDGAVWRFASAEHKALFEADPERYLPAYGGFCAYGTSRGYLVKIEPDAWSIVDGRLYLNYDLGVRETWARRTKTYIARADGNWPRLTPKDIR